MSQHTLSTHTYPDGVGPCHTCGSVTKYACPNNGYPLCPSCNKRRERAYDDYVDPSHWYHQHDPDRVCEA
jgi:hypothetical protein